MWRQSGHRRLVLGWLTHMASRLLVAGFVSRRTLLRRRHYNGCRIGTPIPRPGHGSLCRRRQMDFYGVCYSVCDSTPTSTGVHLRGTPWVQLQSPRRMAGRGGGVGQAKNFGFFQNQFGLIFLPLKHCANALFA